MKKVMISLVMCLMTLISNAQVMTSASVDHLIDSAIRDGEAGFVRKTYRDAHGDITMMEVYREQVKHKGDSIRKPIFRYEYQYAADGMLTSRTKFVWRKSQWRCIGRFDYSLENGIYTVSYSRWNKSKASFGQPAGQISYTLLPDESIASVSYYSRYRHGDALKLEWQALVDSHSDHMNYYITQK